MNNLIKGLFKNVVCDTKRDQELKTSKVKVPKPRVPKAKTLALKSEDPITEKEIQAAMKRIKKIEIEARKRLAEEELKKSNSAKTSVAPVRKKKQAIPSHVKTLIWNYWVGHDKAEAFCLCCNVTKISNRSFHAGHIIAESQGGDLSVKNLKPICGPCNHSMGSMNMDEFIKKFGLIKK